MTLALRLWMLGCAGAGCLMASGVAAQQTSDAEAPPADLSSVEGSGLTGSELPGLELEGSMEPSPTADDSEGSGWVPASTYDPETPPWESIENSVIIPEVDPNEDAEWLLQDEDIQLVDDGPWLRGFGFGQVGVAASDRDRAGVLLGAGAGLARVPEPSADLTTVHLASESLFMVSGLLELGMSEDRDLVPWATVDFLGPRVNRDNRDDGVGTLTLRRDMVWGVARLRRNMRVLRGARTEVGVGSIQLRTVWFERTNVATIIHISADLPGWAYVSAQGRGTAFHGANLTRIAVDVGPRFGASSGPWGRFIIGGEAAAAAGVARGPNGTIRTDLSAWTGADIQAHEHLTLRLVLAMDIARDTYRSLSDSAWRGALTLMSRF